MDEPTTSGPRRIDFDIRQVDHIVAGYIVMAGVWIVASGPASIWLASATGLAIAGLEMAKGLAFVLVTGLVLRRSLRLWAERVQLAAHREHQAAQRLREAEDLRSAFLNGVSHELRTPLTSIIGYSDTVQRLYHTHRTSEVPDLLERLTVNAHRLEDLILDLLNTDSLLRGIGHTALRPVDLDGLIRSATSGRDLAGRHLTLAGAPVTIHADVPKLERVMALLLDNAVRHTPDNAHITIAWQADDDATISLVFEDDGPGLPPTIVNRIFDPFTQGPDAAQGPNPGIGIGLTLVDQYIHLHHGTVTATNAPQGGARIAIRLPVRPDGTAHGWPSRLPTGAAGKGSEGSHVGMR